MNDLLYWLTFTSACVSWLYAADLVTQIGYWEKIDLHSGITSKDRDNMEEILRDAKKVLESKVEHK